MSTDTKGTIQRIHARAEVRANKLADELGIAINDVAKRTLIAVAFVTATTDAALMAIGEGARLAVRARTEGTAEKANGAG